MKVLQVGPNSVHVSRFMNAIQSSELQQYLLSESVNSEVKVEEQFVVNVHTFNPLRIIAFQKEIKKILQKLQPDLIHIHQVNRMAYFVSKIANSLNIPIVTTAWGSDVLLMPGKNRFFYFLVKKTIERSAIVTADALEMITVMHKMVPATSYELIQYGIDPISALDKEKTIYSNRLHEPLYRIDQIIRHFYEFKKMNPNWILKIGAEGSETENLKALARDLGIENKVQFLGWLNHEKNKKEYAKASIYISIPESDGTSVSLLEAMSAGCIPVVSDLPSNREWIQDGKNGVIVQADLNPFESALELDKEPLTQINQQLIQEKATRQASVLKFVSFYQKAIHGK
jgi:L-malate glycosyltransferase